MKLLQAEVSIESTEDPTVVPPPSLPPPLPPPVHKPHLLLAQMMLSRLVMKSSRNQPIRPYHGLHSSTLNYSDSSIECVTKAVL